MSYYIVLTIKQEQGQRLLWRVNDLDFFLEEKNEHTNYLSASSRMIILCLPGGRVTFFWANILILFLTTSMPLHNKVSQQCQTKRKRCTRSKLYQKKNIRITRISPIIWCIQLQHCLFAIRPQEFMCKGKYARCLPSSRRTLTITNDNTT